MKSKKNLNISANNTEEPMEQLFLSFLGSDTKNQSILFEEINKELEAFFTKEFNKKDVTDGVLDLLSIISDSFQEEFDRLISGDSNTKRFFRALSKKFALLLNRKINATRKIQRLIKVAIETTTKKW